MTTLLIILVVAAAIAFAVFAKLKAGGETETNSYKAKRLLTPNELEFLNRLEAAAPELRFHGQVAMGAIIEPNTSRRENGKEYMSLRGKVAQKIIDFIAQDRATGDIVAIIELDDKTHSGNKDAARGSITADAGYKTIRWHSKNKPDAAEIRSKLLPLAKGQPSQQAAKQPAASHLK